jgi:uncharacterized protein (DUF2141 family)
MKKYSYYIYLIITSACASVAMPTGGPKDETPPELISSIPAINEKNFKGNSIELDFNEDIKLKDPKEEILITPSLGKETKFTSKKRKVVIEPELPWTDNTTYNITFREGIQDLTEGNPTDNLRLAFSTGPTIDSLNIYGNVTQTFSDRIPEKITVAIYQADTFNIFNHTPTYFTKTNKKGKFSIENLKAGDYYIYAFDDKNKNLKVDSKTEKFTFQTSKVSLPAEKKDSIDLSLISVDSRRIAISAIRSTDKTTRIRFNKQTDSLKIFNLNKDQGIHFYGENKSELIVYQNFPKQDSIPVRLLATDSVGFRIDTLIYLKYSETKTAQEGFRTKEISAKYNPMNKIFSHKISYNKPITTIQYDSILLTYDSTDVRKIPKENITLDTLQNILTLTTPIETIIPEGEKIPIQPTLTYKKTALITLEEDSSKLILTKVPVITEEESAIVSIKIKTTEPNYEVQIVDRNETIVQSAKNVKEYNFRFLPPDEYKIRVLVDTNNNGKWDAGNFYKKTEPERIVKYVSDEGKKTFPIRANWEYGPLLIEF